MSQGLAGEHLPGSRPNPYVGPRSIRQGEPIYGRDVEIGQLRDVLVAERIVLMYSPSGAGKTSLIEAGLRFALEERDFRVLPTIRVGLDAGASSATGTHGNRYLTSTMLSLEERQPPERRIAIEDLARMSLAEYLGGLTLDDETADPCLVFDQFEELVTLDPTDVDDKAEFMRQLGQALRDRGRWVLFSMREDFVPQLDPYLRFVPTRLRTRYRLDLLGTEAAMTAARNPATDAGVRFSEEAARQLVDDLRRVRVKRGNEIRSLPGPYVEPVQLQVVCRRLWNSLQL